MKTTKIFNLIAIYTSTFIFGCYSNSKIVSPAIVKPPELFSKISIGMERKEVEEILGDSNIGDLENHGKTECWYLPSPKIRSIDSPWGPGAIKIVYENKRVIEKVLNTQGSY